MTYLQSYCLREMEKNKERTQTYNSYRRDVQRNKVAHPLLRAGCKLTQLWRNGLKVLEMLADPATMTLPEIDSRKDIKYVLTDLYL